LINSSTAFSIDELEASLHPELYVHFLLSFLINSKKSQIIATTHNREILINKDIFRNDAIWFTDKSETSATELYSLADFDSSVVRDTSNIFNAYKTGKLGGAPNLGDYYIDISNEKK
jgi:AAA15 family ATPase/GTPase